MGREDYLHLPKGERSQKTSEESLKVVTGEHWRTHTDGGPFVVSTKVLEEDEGETR